MSERTVIRSTSASSADCSDILLRTTEITRLIFRPELVKNLNDPKAAVRGTFIFQRKGPTEEWADAKTIPLSSLKKGEGYKLELHASELRELVVTLVELYRHHHRDGLPIGTTELVRVDSAVARLREVPAHELRKYLAANESVGRDLLGRLLEWAAESEDPSALAARLLSLGEGPLRHLSVAASVGALRQALSIWERNRDTGDEEFWQRVLTEHSLLLEQLFASPVTIVRGKAYVGGKSVMNTGGNLADFLLRTQLTSNAALVEIKTPTTPLLGSEYRDGIFNISAEASGSILQVLSYRQSLQQDFYSVTRGLDEALHAFEPRCLVLIGRSDELAGDDRIRTFELFRSQFPAVTILTFDELFEKTRRLLGLLEQYSA